MDQDLDGRDGDGSQRKSKMVRFKQKANICLPHMGGRRRDAMVDEDLEKKLKILPFTHCLHKMGNKGNT